MERLEVIRFFKWVALVGFAVLSLFSGTISPWWLRASLVLMGAGTVAFIFARFEHWILQLLHEQERSEQLSHQLQSVNRQIAEKNTLLAAKINELTTLRRTTAAMTSTMDLDAVLKVILEAVTHDLGYDRALLCLVETSEETSLVGQQSVGWNGMEAKSVRIPLQGDHPFARAFREKRPQLVSHLEKWPDVLRVYPTAAGKENLIAAIPLEAKDKGVGMLLVDNLRSGRLLREEDLRALLTYTHQAGMAVENARLYLTEKHFHEELARQLEIEKGKLLEAQAKLIKTERLAAVGEMSAMVAHEIKNPLGSIRAIAQLMFQGLPENDARQRYVSLVIKEIDRLDRVVKSLLGYARPAQPRWEPMSVTEIVHETLDILAGEIKQAGVTMKTQLEVKLPTIEADNEQVKQILINIIQNALYMMKQRKTRELRIETAHNHQNVTIRITDTGGGMDPAVLPRIFEPFFTTRSQGTGLGLSICLRLVEAHDGSIDVENKPGEGASFTVTLPISHPDKKS